MDCGDFCRLHMVVLLPLPTHLGQIAPPRTRRLSRLSKDGALEGEVFHA